MAKTVKLPEKRLVQPALVSVSVLALGMEDLPQARPRLQVRTQAVRVDARAIKNCEALKVSGDVDSRNIGALFVKQVGKPARRSSQGQITGLVADLPLLRAA